MKKFLPLLACTLMTGASAFATDLTPQEMPDLLITGISSNGKWAASSDDMYMGFVVVNLDTNEMWAYGESYGGGVDYSGGFGHYVSDNGIIVASTYATELGVYWENGEWHQLPSLDTDWGVYPNCITPDGSRIGGSVAKSSMTGDYDGVATVPVIWERNAEGQYDMYKVVAHPTLDWTGRAPQYVLIDDISADGKTLAADLVDYSGFVNEPVVITEDAEGNWTYIRLQPQLINPDGIEFPTFPGECPEAPEVEAFMTPAEFANYSEALDIFNSRHEPEPTDYMSNAGLDAYLDALEAYYEDYYNNPYPFPREFMTEEEWAEYEAANAAYWSEPRPDAADYMTPEEAAQYQAAYADYEQAYAEWQDSYYEFTDIYWAAVSNTEAYNFEMNSARISPNGKYYVLTAEVSYEDPDSWFGYSTMATPVLFDVEANTYCKLSKGISDVFATQVTDKGWTIGATPASNYTRNAVVAKGMDEPFVLLTDIIKDTDPTLYSWIEENMSRTVTEYTYVENPDTGEYEEVVTQSEQMLLGTPVATDDLSVVATWLYNNWDQYSGSIFYSYILPIKGDPSGINDVATSGSMFGMSVDKAGVITIEGTAANLSVYDLNGCTVFTLDAPAATVATGLSKGAYIVKATSTDGKVVVKKAIF